MTIDCPLHEGGPLNGIIAYLTRECGENIHDKGIVTVAAMSCDCPAGLGRLVDLFRRDGDFATEESPENQWVSWDFHRITVRPTHYQILESDELTMRGSWVVESSMDGQSWTEIDRRSGDLSLRDLSLIGTFEMTTVVDSKFIRLTQLAPNTNGNHRLAMAGVEFYGSFVESVGAAE
jgi:hypothetical protein